MAGHREKPEIVLVDVRVKCPCGELNEFDDVDVDVSSTSQPCEGCGRRIEISLDGFAQWESE